MTARILVVDDQPLNRKLLETKLAAEYYDVVSVADGAAALATFGDNPPDLVLLDIMMPGMDGFEVCRQIKNDPAHAHVPVVMVTALSDTADRVTGLEAGADDFLTKPVNDLALLARVRSLLRIKMALDELRLRDETWSRMGGDSGPSPAAESGTGARVLVVEPEPYLRRRLAEVLGIEHQVRAVDDADAALSAALDDAPELVVVGLGGEGWDGLRLCSRLRSRHATRHLPLLVVAEEQDLAAVAKALELGVNDYIYRPVDANELVARARTQVRHGRYQASLHDMYLRSVSLAVTDGLTGLYNRGYLDTYLRSLFARAGADGKPAALAIIDVDHFKGINDRYGHPVGDAVLRGLGEVLRRTVRASDLAVRLGGEEFVVVMPDSDLAVARAIAHRLHDAIAGALLADDLVPGGVAITASVGVAQMIGADDTPAQLLKRADDALYDAKRAGRNRVMAAAV